MIIRLLNRNYFTFLAVLLAGFMLSCGSDSSKQDRVKVDVDEISQSDVAKQGVQTARQIFYSLPSPLETALILKRSGAAYNAEILNPIENLGRYTTTKSMALNLGIFSTDLSYASLFDQTPASIKYMSASKKLAEGLGILNAIDNSIIDRLEENVNNRDVIMDIISETFLNTNSILEENDRVAIGAIILVGGWIEGVYIATALVDDAGSADFELVERIVDQKVSLLTIVKLLEQYSDNPDVQSVLSDVSELGVIYDKIQVSISHIEVVNDDTSGVATLRGKNVVSVSPKVFQELKDKVKEVRTKYIM
ncbi:MAG: hypothetical protein WC951_04530 [Bacteroidales bacterium]|nr:hypothetical protein [Tenuifilaceae bacterium]